MDPKHIGLIRQQLVQIDKLYVLNHENMQFKQWREKTIMILEKVLGIQDPKVRRFKNINYLELRIKVRLKRGLEERVTREDIKAYREGLDKARLALETIIQEYELFERDKRPVNMDDNTIREKIMEEAYSQYKIKGFHDSVERRNLMERLGISEVDYDRNEEYLNRKGLIEYTSMGRFSITEDGVDLMENPNELQQEEGFGIQLSNIHAPVSIVVGNLNTSISKIEQKGISDLPDILKELNKMIQSSSLKEGDKIEAIENLETVAEQANKTKPNKNVVKAAIDTILEKAGKIAGAVPLIEKILTWFGLS